MVWCEQGTGAQFGSNTHHEYTAMERVLWLLEVGCSEQRVGERGRGQRGVAKPVPCRSAQSTWSQKHSVVRMGLQRLSLKPWHIRVFREGKWSPHTSKVLPILPTERLRAKNEGTQPIETQPSLVRAYMSVTLWTPVLVQIQQALPAASSSRPSFRLLWELATGLQQPCFFLLDLISDLRKVLI